MKAYLKKIWEQEIKERESILDQFKNMKKHQENLVLSTFLIFKRDYLQFKIRFY
jgi:hypothetical protein